MPKENKERRKKPVEALLREKSKNFPPSHIKLEKAVEITSAVIAVKGRINSMIEELIERKDEIAHAYVLSKDEALRSYYNKVEIKIDTLRDVRSEICEAEHALRGSERLLEETQHET